MSSYATRCDTCGAPCPPRPPPVTWNLCSAGGPGGVEFPDAGQGMCCIGAAVYGPERCTCWRPVFDVEQVPPVSPVVIEERRSMCQDCAYRPGSYERQDDHEEEHLMALPQSGATVFWCHQGMRAPRAWRHGPTGTEIPGDPDRDYRPAFVEHNGQQVPLRADGTAARICAGWATRRRVERRK